MRWLLAVLVGCGGAPAPVAAVPGPPPLYDRLGGRDALMDVVDALLARPASAHGAATRTRLIDQLCELTGGPCKYTGRPLGDAHTGVTAAQLDAFLAELDAVLATRVGPRERRELLALLRGLHAEVVE